MHLQGVIDRAVAEIGTVLLGKEGQIRLALCCLFARGHLLIEDLPGMGKTTLSHALADALGLSWKRVQFHRDASENAQCVPGRACWYPCAPNPEEPHR